MPIHDDTWDCAMSRLKCLPDEIPVSDDDDGFDRACDQLVAICEWHQRNPELKYYAEGFTDQIDIMVINKNGHHERVATYMP